MKTCYDYVVVGAGSAGCVVAARLSENTDATVLLLEAGGDDRSILLSMPLAFRALRNAMKFDWGYASEPEPHAADRSILAARGKVLGGSSSVNGMMYSRGHPEDYDQWAQMGARGWSYDEVLPLFRRSEQNWRGASQWHGGDGPLSVSRLDDDALTVAMHETARRLGYAISEDFEGAVREGFGLPDLTIGRGRRSSASQAFLKPARGRQNLDIATGATVRRIVIENGRAIGVEFDHRGATRVVKTNQEVVLSAGAFGSPQLLMLSGVGPAAHLRKHGISAHVDAPEVGANLQDHPLTPLGFKAKRPFALGGQLRADRLLLAALRWQFTGKGLAATAPLTSIAFYKSREGLDRPDLETLFMPTSLAADVWFPGVRARHPDIMTTLNVALRPMSRGAVTLRSADPRDKPIIQFNFLAEPSDIEKLRFALRWTRELVTNTPISDFIGDEAFPGVSIDSDTALDAYIRKTVTTTQHPAGTCRMGADEAAVVDPQLRVRGVERLRVADASIMPLLISGHTNAPAIMIGEKCAIMIRGGAGDASLQSALAT